MAPKSPCLGRNDSGVKVSPAPPPPTIRLDRTLADLYREAGVEQPLIAITYHPWTHIDLHPHWPRESVYPQDEDPKVYGVTEQERGCFRRAELAFWPLKGAFPLGNMEVFFSSNTVERTLAQQIWDRFAPDQRPKMRFVDLNEENVQPQQKIISHTQGKILVYSYPYGWMRNLNCMVPPGVVHQLESKRFLLESDLRVPRMEMMSLEDPKTIASLENKLLPFVVKAPIASSSHGTWIVKTEAARVDMLSAVVKFRLRGGTDVQVSEYIVSEHSYCVQFFVGPGPVSRQPLFAAVTIQTFDEDNRWAGAGIDFGLQETYREQFRGTIKDTICSLPDNFSGWVGVDVLIDKRKQQYVVDLNPRMTGSMPLCLLSGFFWAERGLRYAQTGSVEFCGLPQSFHDVMAAEIAEGEVIVLATALLDKERCLSIAWLVWGSVEYVTAACFRTKVRQRLQIFAQNCKEHPQTSSS